MKTLTVCILLMAIGLNYVCAEKVNEQEKISEISNDELNRLNSFLSKFETSDEINAAAAAVYDDDDEDESNENDEYIHHNNKRMTYRYGKRMNYRYGKRAAMPFRFGKRNSEMKTLSAQDLAEYIKLKQNNKRMNYRYGK